MMLSLSVTQLSLALRHFLPDHRFHHPRYTYEPWPNMIVAASNWLTGLWAVTLWWDTDILVTVLVLCALMGSTLYHLAERKGLLPGVSPFRKYEYILLNVDRTVAFALGIVLVWKTLYLPWTVAIPILMLGSFGVGLNIASEYLTGPSFVWCHSWWHFVAFLIPVLIYLNR